MNFYLNKFYYFIKCMSYFFFLITNHLKVLFSNFFFIKNFTYSFSESDYLNSYKEYNDMKKLQFCFFNFVYLDFMYFLSKKINFKNFELGTNFFSSNYSLLSTKNNFYFNLNNFNNNKKYSNFLKNYNLNGYFYILNGLKIWFIPLFILFSTVYMFLVLKSLPFNKMIFSWMCILMFSYWLLSGFVFFFKKYQFGKYTTSIQSFWSSTYILFWLMEGSTFLVFLFFTMNASQESFYMFDQSSMFKSHLYSWKLFFLKLFPVVMLMIFSYFLLLSLKWNLFSKHSIWLLLMTFFLTYTVWLEFYQFFHVLNFYSNLNWVYDLDDHSWSLESESSKSSMVNHYVMLLFMLKFWHIVFMYGFWLFFVLRSLEIKSMSYSMLSANFQNFMMLYMFTWVFMYPWFKFFLSKFLDTPYYWFYVNNSKLFFSTFFYDFKLMYYGILSYFEFFNFNKFNLYNFYYFNLSNSNNNYEFFKKNYIKNKILLNLNKI